MRSVIRGLRSPGAKLSRRRRQLRKDGVDVRTRRFVVTYTEPRDPSTEEVVNLKKGFARIKVLDEMPGTVLVEGPASEVSNAVGSVEHWAYAEEGQFTA